MTLKISNFSKKYNDKWVLRDVSFEVEKGKILGLVGETASGKSTLLRLIFGSEKANSGEIFFEEKNLTSNKDRGFVLIGNQINKSWKDFFSSGKNSLSDSETQIENFENQIKNTNSVILLDNPFNSLDGWHFQKFSENLKTIVCKKNLAGIFATNNSEEVFSVCDQIAVLKNGEIVDFASPREVYEKPKCVASAETLGRCNFIKSRRITFNNQSILEFQTLEGDHHLRVDKVEKSALGAITQDITLAIRPEHISIAFGASFPEDNLLKAEIMEINYQGATTRIKLNANGLFLEALVLRLVGLNIGDECMIGLPPDRILVLKN